MLKYVFRKDDPDTVYMVLGHRETHGDNIVFIFDYKTGLSHPVSVDYIIPIRDRVVTQYNDFSEIDDLDRKVKEFAEACFLDDSVDELADALFRAPDEEDMKVWNINNDERRMALEAALHAKTHSELVKLLGE